MATRAELLQLVKEKPEDIVDLLLSLTTSKTVINPKSSDSVDDIIAGMIGSVSTGLMSDLVDVPDISHKLTQNLQALVDKLKKDGH